MAKKKLPRDQRFRKAAREAGFRGSVPADVVTNIFRQLEAEDRAEAAIAAPITSRLRDAIDDTGQTVAAVARGAGIAQPVLYRFMKGERDLTLRTADKLATYLDLELRPRNEPRPQGS